jgi:hypothetical protein
MDALLKADGWFINLVAFGGALYFLYSAKSILQDLKLELSDLKKTIERIFDKHADHEQRISRLEGICKGRRHGESCYIEVDHD